VDRTAGGTVPDRDPPGWREPPCPADHRDDGAGGDRPDTAAYERLMAIADAVDRVGAGRDEAVVGRELGAYLHPDLCDAVLVELAPPQEGSASPDPSGLWRRVATYGHPSVTAVVVAAWSRAGRSGGGSLGGEVRWDGGGGALVSAGPPSYGSGSVLLPDGGRAEVLLVPLQDRGTRLGTVVAVRTRAGGFDPVGAAAVRFAVRQTSLHVRHARELAAAESSLLHLQSALLADPGRPHPNLEFAADYLPAGAGRSTMVGGDWCQTVRLHFGRTLLAVGDVMGHGIEAAVDMNAYRGALRDIASTDLAPHRVLRRLDALVDAEARRPATCVLVRMDPSRDTASFSAAGHLPPIVFHADGTATVVELPVGPPLGTGFGGYELVTYRMTPDDTLLLYTDGLVERRGEDIDVSLSRLTALRPAHGLSVSGLVDAVVDGLGARDAEDDVAVLAARFTARSSAAGPV
ncbi:PP2C family protein-serine/threonine phosphatase, partial [Streptomyces sp. NPDC046887]|uniref:PP2C family protein-serine/threonine phosphatase n=1 Tax=Streptomyces sp. NPDC046887 TaxID=3155472 RepID=UPI0034032DB6